LKNDVFIEAVRCILGLPSHILQPYADGHHFIGRNAILIDAYGIAVKDVMLIMEAIIVFTQVFKVIFVGRLQAGRTIFSYCVLNI